MVAASTLVRPMHFDNGHIYHVYNRGNNKQIIFPDKTFYVRFLGKLRNECKPVCEILAWCLMPNHFHLLLFANAASCEVVQQSSHGGVQVLSKTLGKTLSSYAQYFQRRMNVTGSVFQQKTKAKRISVEEKGKIVVNEKYLADCFAYIHNNPVKAGLVNFPELWPFSSYTDFAQLRSGTLCNKELACQLLGVNADFFHHKPGIAEIRQSKMEPLNRARSGRCASGPEN